MTPYHILLTRYNIGLFSPGNAYAERLQQLGFTPESWMEERIGHFHRMAASVENQSVPFDDWFVFVDPNTPRHYLDEIEACIPSDMAYAGPTGVTSLIPTEFSSPQEVHDWSKRPILTSRVDNDDFLLPDYAKRVREVAESVTDGVDTVIDARGQIRDARGRITSPVWTGRPVSMFISLVEFGPTIKTVMCQQHPHLHRHYRAIYIDQVLWEINLHGKNLRNTARG